MVHASEGTIEWFCVVRLCAEAGGKLRRQAKPLGAFFLVGRRAVAKLMGFFVCHLDYFLIC